jgi:hypothetical protein
MHNELKFTIYKNILYPDIHIRSIYYAIKKCLLQAENNGEVKYRYEIAAEMFSFLQPNQVKGSGLKRPVYIARNNCRSFKQRI